MVRSDGDRRMFSHAVTAGAKVAALVLCGGMLAGCGSEDFPGAPDASGDLNVPYVTTYNFGFQVRFDPVFGVNGNLQIISSSDLLNLVSAANIARVPGTGVISGRALTTTQGISAQNVVLIATDAAGDRLGEFFYNSLGGTPDFVQTRGTTAAGGFTALNVSPGEVFLAAVAGGRGASRLLAFPDEVSLGTVMVTPVVVPVIGVVGEITDEVGRGVAGTSIGIEVVGQRLSEAATCSDERPTQDRVNAAQVGGTAAFRFCVASEGDYFARLSGDSFVPTYQFFSADSSELTALQTAELTEFFTIQTRAGLDAAAASAGTTWDPTRGVVFGQVRYGAGGPRSNAVVRITDEEGRPNQGILQYLDELGRPSADPFTSATGRFVAFNVPIPNSKTVNISVIAQEETSGQPARYAATVVSPVIPGAAVFWGIDLRTLPPPVTGEDNFCAYFTGPVSGQVIREDGLDTVANARITPLGVPLADYFPARDPQDGPEVHRSEIDGRYRIAVNPANGRVNPTTGGIICELTAPSADTATTPLLQSALYVVKVEGPGGPTDPDYMSTYQRLTAGAAQQDPTTRAFLDTQTQNLFLVPRAAIQGYANHLISKGKQVDVNASSGVLIGTVVDLATNLPATGVSLRLASIDGTNGQPPAPPSLYYFDFGGVPNPDLTATTADGRFIVFNVPPGAVSLDVTSVDDTGNALADSRAGGVTVMRIDVNNAQPETVDVSGSITPLVGTLPSNGLVLTAAGGDPMAQRQRCPAGTAERGGLCYQDPVNLQGLIAKEPIPCSDTTVYGPYRVRRNQRDGYCQLEYGPASPLGPFAFPVGSSREVTLKTSGPGFMDTYTFGLQTRDRAVNDVSVGAVTAAAMETVAQSGGVTFDKNSAVIWGQTTAASLGKVALDGTVAPLTCDAPAWTTLPSNLPVGCSGIGIPGAFVTGYFNADVYRDFAIIDTTSSTAPRITIWLNTGSGSFALSQEIVKNPPGGGTCLVKDVGCGVEEGPVALLVLDYTRDGLSDLVVVNRAARSISLLEGRGQGVFVFGGSQPVGSDPTAVATGDIDRNQILDLFVTDNSGEITLLVGTGAGFQPPRPGDWDVGNQPFAVLSGQLDFDGIPDLIFVNKDSIATMRQVGVTNGLTTYPMSGSSLEGAAIGDLDGDLLNDVVVADAASGGLRIWVFLNSLGQLQAPTQIQAGPQPPIEVALTDLNGDRSLDLVVLHLDGGLIHYQGDGLGGFGQPQRSEVGGIPFALIMDDVTGDGAIDAVVSDPGLNRVAILPLTQRPVGGVAVAAVQANGQAVGDLVYLDAQGTAISGVTVTGASGRFAIFNVPPGPIWLRLVTGGLGSRFLHAYAGSVTNTTFPVITGLDATTTISGVTADAVLRPVGEVQIRFLGTQRATSSNPIVRDSRGNATGGADYVSVIEANSDYIVKLSK